MCQYLRLHASPSCLPLPGCRACRTEGGAPAAAERARLLSALLDVPRLLDLCALYGAARSSQLCEILQAGGGPLWGWIGSLSSAAP